LNPNGTVSSKKKEQKNSNAPSSRQRLVSPSSQTAAARPATTPCTSLPWQNHRATCLPAQRLLLPLALIHHFSHFADRQIQETSDEVPTAGQPPRGLLVVFLAQMRPECFQGREPSGRSQWTVVVLFVFSKYLHFRPLLPEPLLSTSSSTNRQQGHLFILEPAHHSHRLRLYHKHYVYFPIHFSGASTFPCARPVWSQTTISRVTQRQTVTVTNDFARFGHRVGPGWARHVTFGNG